MLSAGQHIRRSVESHWRARSRYSRVVIVAAIAVATIMAFGGIAAFSKWFGTQEALATWVQAIGTLLALAIAIFAPVWQAEEAERRRRQAELRAAVNIVELSRDVISQVNERFKSLDSAERLIRSRDYLARIRHLAAMIDRVDISVLSEFVTTVHFVKVGEALAALNAIIGRFDDCETNDAITKLYSETLDDVSKYAGCITDRSCKDFIAAASEWLKAGT